MKYFEKVKGARAILGWTREELAKQASLSVPGITGVETGSSPNARTQDKIERAIGEYGVYFTRIGIEKDDSPIVTFADENPERCYLKLLEDVTRVLKHAKKPELLIAYADDRVSPPAVVEAYRTIRKNGAAMRQLVEEGNSYLMGPVEEYRYIPSTHFINRVTLIYASNVATLTAGESTVSIMRDPVNAARERNSFDLLWAGLDAPAESTADERF